MREDGDVRVEMDASKVIARYLFVFQSDHTTHGPDAPAIPSVGAADLCEICEKHVKTQAATLDAVKKALQDL